MAFHGAENPVASGIRRRPRSESVRAVVRALRILECLADERSELGISDLAKRTQLGLATCHRLLGTLRTSGYVAKSSQSGRYLLGYRSLAITGDMRVLADNLLLANAGSVLKELTDAFGETSNLAVRDGVHARFLAQAPGKAALRMVTVVGDRIPLHTSAVGKVIIAHSVPQVLEEVLAVGLDKVTQRSITNAHDLMSALENVRREGVAIDNEEFEEGLTCVAAPVFDYTGSVRAAISVSGPTSRMTRIMPRLRAAVPLRARKLSEYLGFEAAMR